MKAFFSILLFFTLLPCFGQLQSYSFEEASELSKSDPKPFVVFIHTSWCKYCEMMKQTTFKNNEVVEMLNHNFYFIDFDAEDPRSIRFNGADFNFRPKGNRSGVHELATELAQVNNSVVYPTLAFLETDYSISLQKQSFTDAKTLLALLKQMQPE